MKEFSCALEYPREELIKNGFPHKGKWNDAIFHRDSPITVELGCGKGEYTVGLARNNAQRNYIGTRGLYFLALPDVRGESYDFTMIIISEPF